jgi:ABC-2 type transport system permease protein
MFSSVFKQIRLFPAYLRLSVKKQTEYKVSFYVFIINSIIQFGIWILFWELVLRRLESIGEWGFPLLVVLTGFATIAQGLVFMFGGIWRLSTVIIKGELNLYLVRPLQPLMHYIMTNMNVRSLPRSVLGAVLVGIGVGIYQLPFSFGSILLAAAVSMLSFLAIFIPFVMVGILAFWLGRAEFIRDLFFELFIFQNYPLTVFPAGFLFFFTYIIPFVFSATMPALVLVRFSMGESLQVLGILAAVVIVQLFIIAIVWKRGLQRYESSGG